MNHKRAQTACSLNKQRHQLNLLKEIKFNQQLQQEHSNYCNKLNRNFHHTPNKRIYKSPLGKQIFQIEKLKGKKKSMFSLVKDEIKICQKGWNEFSEQIQRKTHSNFMDIRTQFQQIKKRQKTSTILLKEYLDTNQAQNQVFLVEQKIDDLWKAVKGEAMNQSNFGYLRLGDLAKDIKTSLTLSNAYKLCVKSKNYRQSKEKELTHQKFKSYIYLKQNANKLPKKKYDQLMKNNYFLP